MSPKLPVSGAGISGLQSKSVPHGTKHSAWCCVCVCVSVNEHGNAWHCLKKKNEVSHLDGCCGICPQPRHFRHGKQRSSQVELSTRCWRHLICGQHKKMNQNGINSSKTNATAAIRMLKPSIDQVQVSELTSESCKICCS